MRDFPQYYPYFRATQFVFNGRVIKTHNRLVTRYAGTDGIKTGYINASGYNLVSSVRRGNKRLVGVVLGGRSAGSRDSYMMAMLTRGFPKAQDGKMVAAKAGSTAGIADPLQNLKKTPNNETAAAAVQQQQQQQQQDLAALAAASNDASTGGTDTDEDAAEAQDQGAPKVIEAELAGSMDGSDTEGNEVQGQQVASTQPAQQKALPFQVKKAATQADVDALSVGTLPAAWAVEIGDFQTRKGASDVVAKLKAKDETRLAGKDSKTIAVKRNGKMLYRLLVTGYDEMSAKKSCAQVARLGKDCAVLAPNG
jgi:D-alanyl-D-alanine carboxypeptidase